MKDVLTGRVDLVRALEFGGAELQHGVARLLGMEYLAPPTAPPRKPSATLTFTFDDPIVEVTQPAADARFVPFWYPKSFVVQPGSELDSDPDEGDKEEDETDEHPARAEAAFSPLASRAAILTRLRRVSAFRRVSGEVDIDRVVWEFSRGRLLEVLPRRSRRSWGQSIQVIVDRHHRLIPYWRDQDEAVRALERVYPRDGFQVATLTEGASDPSVTRPRRQVPYSLPESGTAVVVLGDLGALAPQGSRARESWAEWGRRYREHGNQTIALVPCDPGAVPEEVARHWTIIPWERPSESRGASLSPDRAERAAEDIVTLLSFALRVEPGLVREVRRLLVDGRADPGVESRVWQHEALQSRHFEAAAFRAEAVRPLRDRIGDYPTELRLQVYELAAKMRQSRYPGVWYAELLGMESEAAKVGFPRAEIEKAGRWFRKQPRILKEIGAEKDPTMDEATWLLRVFYRLPGSAYRGSASRALHRIWSMIVTLEDQPPPGIDPAKLPRAGHPVRTVELRQEADTVLTRVQPTTIGVGDPQSEFAPAGSLLAPVQRRNPMIAFGPEARRLDEHGLVTVIQNLSSIRVCTDRDILEFEVMTRPDWTSAIGRDQFGLWTEFSIGETVRQRLRWIPPGRFAMGSPAGETGRWGFEGPQRSVRIPQGFWLFDTPCTQSLWKAVMGRNPSKYRSSSRPVERVSWDDAQEFISKLNGLLKGLELSLPSEAQWEYACRAGTTTATYAGDLEIHGGRDAPILDGIAWYGGNCGVDYKLSKGEDISSWPEKQYEMKTGGTHPVGRKLPNGWGLYDMLGNVWEWCADEYRSDLTARRAGESASADRVVRGGSWIINARFVRAAYRNGRDPGHRDAYLGFRCGEFRSGTEEVERVVSGSERRAEHREDRSPTSETSFRSISE